MKKIITFLIILWGIFFTYAQNTVEYSFGTNIEIIGNNSGQSVSTPIYPITVLALPANVTIVKTQLVFTNVKSNDLLDGFIQMAKDIKYEVSGAINASGEPFDNLLVAFSSSQNKTVDLPNITNSGGIVNLQFSDVFSGINGIEDIIGEAKLLITYSLPLSGVTATVVNNVTCNGGSTGSAKATPTGGTSPYTYLWNTNPPQTTATATGLKAGTYTVTVTDAESSQKTADVTITEPAAIIMNTVTDQTICNSTTTTNAINFANNLEGIICGYAIEYSTLSLSAPLGALFTDVLFASYGNASGSCEDLALGWCNAANSQSIISNLALGKNSFSLYVGNGTFGDSCPNTSKNLKVKLAYGIAIGQPVTYAWTNDNTSIGLASSGTGNIPSFTGTNSTNAPITATITVTPSYNNGSTICSGLPITFKITVNPTPVIISQPASQLICKENNATFSATVSNASGYQWQVDSGSGFNDISNNENYSGATTATLTIVSAKTNMDGFIYRLKINTNNCSVISNEATLTVSSIIGTTDITNVSCNGGSNGSINLTPSGGTSPYTFDWGSGITTKDRADLPAGTYTVIITDSKGCKETISATITEPAAIIMNTVANQTTCSGYETDVIHFGNNLDNVMCGYANEGSALSLTASDDQIFTDVLFASYGNASGSCEDLLQGYCHSENSVAVVSNAVLGQNSFTIDVTNDTFGDPCGGVSKGLKVKLVYGLPITYSWTNDNTSIGLASSGTGNIPSFTGTNSSNAPETATITVTPSYNNGGTICSGTPTTFTITINPMPVFISQPSDSSACEGTNAIFSATVSNATEYQWQVDEGNGFNDISDDELYSGATTATLTITDVTPDMYGYYRVIVNPNGCMEISNEAALNVSIAYSPSGEAVQSFNTGDDLSAFEVEGDNVKWYATESNAINHIGELPITTLIVNNTTYYAAQTNEEGCESKIPLAVKALNETLGINETDTQSSIKIHPNPASDILNITSKEEIIGYEIFDLSGRKLNSAKKSNIQNINISNLLQNSYILKLKTKSGYKSYKFIKK